MDITQNALLERMAATLDQMLAEMRQANERHLQLDQSAADAEHARRNPYENV